MRGDVNLLGYTFENVAYHLLKQRQVRLDTGELVAWPDSSSGVI